MAVFPAIEPTDREYDFGVFPMSAVSFTTGGEVRFSHSDEAIDHGLTLRFSELPESQVAQVRAHYAGQDDGVLSFALPDTIWLGHDTPEDVVPATHRWVYSAPPDETPVAGALYDLAVSLRNVGPE
jgi:hypothetical protein